MLDRRPCTFRRKMSNKKAPGIFPSAYVLFQPILYHVKHVSSSDILVDDPLNVVDRRVLRPDRRSVFHSAGRCRVYQRQAFDINLEKQIVLTCVKLFYNVHDFAPVVLQRFNRLCDLAFYVDAPADGIRHFLMAHGCLDAVAAI